MNVVIAKRLLFLSLALAGGMKSLAQQTTNNGGYMMPGVVVDGDTMASFQAKPVLVLPPAETQDPDELHKFRKLVRNIKLVYPYAKKGKVIFQEMQLALDTMTNKRQRKSFIKSKENELSAQYAEELKALSVNQGQLLMKLIDRELHKTSYDIIKEMRGSMQAMMWQQLAKFFGSNLKSTYDANGEDKMIEKIILMIDCGQL